MKHNQAAGNKTHTLLIWEMIPESTYLVVIPNDQLDAEDIKTLHLAHNAFGNTDASEAQETAINNLGAAVCSNPKYLDDRYPNGSRWAMRFVGSCKPLDVSHSLTRYHEHRDPRSHPRTSILPATVM